MKKSNLTGQKFNRLLVISEYGMKSCRTFYNCLSDCGKTVVVAGSKLPNNHTKSCGCLATETRSKNGKQQALPSGMAQRNRVLDNYKRNARVKGLVWELPKEQAFELFSTNCFYCGRPPATLASNTRMNGQFIYNGIDRKDNKLGYMPDNVVACCLECNDKKRDTNIYEFLNWIRSIYKNLNLEELNG